MQYVVQEIIIILFLTNSYYLKIIYSDKYLLIIILLKRLVNFFYVFFNLKGFFKRNFVGNVQILTLKELSDWYVIAIYRPISALNIGKRVSQMYTKLALLTMSMTSRPLQTIKRSLSSSIRRVEASNKVVIIFPNTRYVPQEIQAYRIICNILLSKHLLITILQVVVDSC